MQNDFDLVKELIASPITQAQILRDVTVSKSQLSGLYRGSIAVDKAPYVLIETLANYWSEFMGFYMQTILNLDDLGQDLSSDVYDDPSVKSGMSFGEAVKEIGYIRQRFVDQALPKAAVVITGGINVERSEIWLILEGPQSGRYYFGPKTDTKFAQVWRS